MSGINLHVAGVILLLKFCVGGSPITWVTPTSTQGSCGNINENAQPGAISTVMVNATSTVYDITEYTVSNSSNDVVFSFNVTGHGMLVSGSIDYESVTSLTFVVVAKDSGNDMQTATCTVAVNDLNDNAPVFANASISVTVANGTMPDGMVTTVTAADADGSSPNNQVEYTISAGNTNQDFKIMPNTGVIHAAKELNMARTQEYDLTVTAMDKGVPAMSSTAKVEVCVGSCIDDSNAAVGTVASLLCLMASFLVYSFV